MRRNKNEKIERKDRYEKEQEQELEGGGNKQNNDDEK